MLKSFETLKSWHYCTDESYNKFIIWLIRSCLDELSPGASMPRILSSLMILNLISKFKNQPCSDFIARVILDFEGFFPDPTKKFLIRFGFFKSNPTCSQTTVENFTWPTASSNDSRTATKFIPRNQSACI